MPRGLHGGLCYIHSAVSRLLTRLIYVSLTLSGSQTFAASRNRHSIVVSHVEFTGKWPRTSTRNVELEIEMIESERNDRDTNISQIIGLNISLRGTIVHILPEQEPFPCNAPNSHRYSASHVPSG